MSKPSVGKKVVRQVVIFLHLPKAAGSTLVRIIERQYGQDKVLKLYDSFYGGEVAGLPPERKVNLKAVIGHLYFGVHAYLPGPATYVTFLRDPVSRIISHYHYVRQDPGHYLYPAAQQLSIKDYVIYCGKCEPNNDQTRLLAGREHALDDGTWSEEMFPAAKRNLREYFSVAGLVEEFDRSLVLMKRALGWQTPFYVKRNVSHHGPEIARIDPETVDVIRSYNELDAGLHAYARQLLHEQVRYQGESLERELRLFKTLNAVYGRLHAIAMKFLGLR